MRHVVEKKDLLTWSSRIREGGMLHRDTKCLCKAEVVRTLVTHQRHNVQSQILKALNNAMKLLFAGNFVILIVDWYFPVEAQSTYNDDGGSLVLANYFITSLVLVQVLSQVDLVHRETADPLHRSHALHLVLD